MKPTQDQLESLRKHWDLEGPIQFHRRVANFVYFCQCQGEPVVLRLTDPSHRQAPEIESELHWLSFLSEQGLGVAHPIPSFDSRYVHSVPGENLFSAALFRKALGAPLTPQGLTTEFMETWGRYMGQMHKATQLYQPPSTIQARQAWNQDQSLTRASVSFPTAEPHLVQRLLDLLEWLKTLPQEVNSYGLVHGDLHNGNFFVDQNHQKIIAFDFDDSCYHWFAYDMVPAINSILNMRDDHRLSFSDEQIKDAFLRGYFRSHTLEDRWLNLLPSFEKYRAALVYFWIQTGLRENIFDAKGLEWVQKRTPYLKTIFDRPI